MDSEAQRDALLQVQRDAELNAQRAAQREALREAQSGQQHAQGEGPEANPSPERPLAGFMQALQQVGLALGAVRHDARMLAGLESLALMGEGPMPVPEPFPEDIERLGHDGRRASACHARAIGLHRQLMPIWLDLVPRIAALPAVGRALDAALASRGPAWAAAAIAVLDTTRALPQRCDGAVLRALHDAVVATLAATVSLRNALEEARLPPLEDAGQAWESLSRLQTWVQGEVGAVRSYRDAFDALGRHHGPALRWRAEQPGAAIRQQLDRLDWAVASADTLLPRVRAAPAHLAPVSQALRGAADALARLRHETDAAEVLWRLLGRTPQAPTHDLEAQCLAQRELLQRLFAD